LAKVEYIIIETGNFGLPDVKIRVKKRSLNFLKGFGLLFSNRRMEGATQFIGSTVSWVCLHIAGSLIRVE
jgi:hypothetical protein